LKGSPDAAARRAKRDEKANKTRKIKIVQVEIKQEAQTSKCSFRTGLFEMILINDSSTESRLSLWPKENSKNEA
jgi:hypothetical protein